MTFTYGADLPLAAPSPHDTRKNRYISFNPNNPDASPAFQVEMTSGPGATGVVGWVNAPSDPAGTGDWVSTVVDSPVYRAWPESVIHIADCEITPVATYEIRATTDGVSLSSAVEVATIELPGAWFHGDIVGESTGTEYTPPQQVVNVSDVQAVLFCMQELEIAPHMTWCDLHGLGAGTPPNYLANVSDLQLILRGQEGLTFLASHADNLTPENCP